MSITKCLLFSEQETFNNEAAAEMFLSLKMISREHFNFGSWLNLQHCMLRPK